MRTKSKKHNVTPKTPWAAIIARYQEREEVRKLVNDPDLFSQFEPTEPSEAERSDDDVYDEVVKLAFRS